MPNEEKKDRQVAIRLDEATLVRVDALKPAYAIPGRKATRSDVLRAMVLKGLDAPQTPLSEEARRMLDAGMADAKEGRVATAGKLKIRGRKVVTT